MKVWLTSQNQLYVLKDMLWHIINAEESGLNGKLTTENISAEWTRTPEKFEVLIDIKEMSDDN